MFWKSGIHVSSSPWVNDLSQRGEGRKMTNENQQNADGANHDRRRLHHGPNDLRWRKPTAADDEGSYQRQRNRSRRSNCNGTVEYVEGQHPAGSHDGWSDFESSTCQKSRKFTIRRAGKRRFHDLKPGTKTQAATVTTTTTPHNRPDHHGGKQETVYWVAGKTVILTLPNGEKQTVHGERRLQVQTSRATRRPPVFDLRKGMRVSAQKIVEEPQDGDCLQYRRDWASPSLPPAPKTVVAQAPPPAPAPKREVAQARPEPAPRSSSRSCSGPGPGPSRPSPGGTSPAPRDGQ